MTSALPPATPLHRRGTDKMLGGVCGGLAEYSVIDPLLWRAGFVALALAGPGVIVYLLLWLLMPLGPTGPDYRPGPFDQLVERLHRRLTGAAGTPVSN
jgi:phage shock protein C